MKSIVFLALVFLGLAHAATRIGVYTGSDCAESSIVGYIWYPKFYPWNETTIQVTSCTAVGGSTGQYYDVKLNLAEQSQSSRSTEWAYWYGASQSQVDGCDSLNDTTAIIITGKPNTCWNFIFPIRSSSYFNTSTSYKLSDCTKEGYLDIVSADSFGCNAAAQTLSDMCIYGQTQLNQAICNAATPNTKARSFASITAPVASVVVLALAALMM